MYHFLKCHFPHLIHAEFLLLMYTLSRIIIAEESVFKNNVVVNEHKYP